MKIVAFYLRFREKLPEMKVFAKHTTVIKKSLPTVEKGISDEEDIQKDEEKSSRSFLYVTVLAALITILVLSFGLVLGQQVFKLKSGRHYQGFCSILIPKDMGELTVESNMFDTNFHVLPLKLEDNDVQIVSPVHEFSEDFVQAVREELDIGGTIERISVVDDGHKVNFIHDFSDNTSGIIDTDRCWVMDLDPDFVLSPDSFIQGLEHGGTFDVSRVKASLVAVIPALDDLSNVNIELSLQCMRKPIYRLTKDFPRIAKRATYNRPHNYLQFAGKHVQQIFIENLSDVLQHEDKKNKK